LYLGLCGPVDFPEAAIERLRVVAVVGLCADMERLDGGKLVRMLVLRDQFPRMAENLVDVIGGVGIVPRSDG